MKKKAAAQNARSGGEGNVGKAFNPLPTSKFAVSDTKDISSTPSTR